MTVFLHDSNDKAKTAKTKKKDVRLILEDLIGLMWFEIDISNIVIKKYKD